MLIECYFDGSCEPYNPGGRMGFGVIIKKDKQVIHEWSYSVAKHPDNSNNVAEYGALEYCLKWLIENEYKKEVIFIKGDSKMVIEQMSGRWRIKAGRYKEYALSCKSLLTEFSSIHFHWIPREKNEHADLLSKS